MDAENSEPSPDEISDSQENELETPTDTDDESAENAQEGEEDWDEPAEELMDLDFSDEFSVLQEMQEDLREHYQRGVRRRSTIGKF